MTATNHALTGAVIGFTISNPAIALPLALISHVITDAIPHFADDRAELSSRKFRTLLYADMSVCVLLVLALAVLHPMGWLLASLCAFIATSPDVLWLPDFIASVKGTKKPEYGPIRRFLSWVQWSETRQGAYIEIIWFIGLSILVVAQFGRA